MSSFRAAASAAPASVAAVSPVAARVLEVPQHSNASARPEPLLRTLLGEALRTERLGQHRTLRHVSQAARVSLGYLSEIERGQKEASSELLASICTALEIRLADVLHLVLTLAPGPRVRIVEPLPVLHPERVDSPVVDRAA